MSPEGGATGSGSLRGKPIYAPTRGSGLVGQSVNLQGNELALRRRDPGLTLEMVPGEDRLVARAGPRFATGVNPLPSITGPFLPRG